jgi:hypothetical protein
MKSGILTIGLAATLVTVPVVAAAQSGIEVEAAVALAIEDRIPVDTGSAFPADVGRVWLWTSVTGAAGQTMSHVWSHGEHEWVVELQIGADRGATRLSRPNGLGSGKSRYATGQVLS